MAEQVVEYADTAAAAANSGSDTDDDDDAYTQGSVTDHEVDDDYTRCSLGDMYESQPPIWFVPRQLPTLPEEGIDIAIRMFRLIEKHKQHCTLLRGPRKYLPVAIPTDMIRIIRSFAGRIQVFPSDKVINRDIWPFALCRELERPSVYLDHLEDIDFWRKFETCTRELLERLNCTNTRPRNKAPV
jgi:hypothetical protein